MRQLYILQQYYEDDNWEEHGCYLGIFATEEECMRQKKVIEESGRFPERDGMKNIYNISLYIEGEDHWVGGFV